MNHRLLYPLILTLCAISPVMAEELKDSVLIHFRQSKVEIDPEYMNNEEAFRHVKQTISRFNQPDSNFVLLDVKVVGGASPEGSVKFNEWLSKERATRIYDYMDSRMMLPDSLSERTLLGRDWEGLRAMVESDKNVPDREGVLATLDDIITKYRRGEKESDGNLERLKALDGGIPYLYLYHQIFPRLRESRIVLTFGNPMPILPILPASELPLGAPLCDPVPIMLRLPSQSDRPFYMALKSNLLSDALSIPEIGIEFYLGKNLSIVGNWWYGWWDKDSSHRYWRDYGGDVALRWWFGKAAKEKPLTGHHVGVYGGVVTYDFEFGGKGYMGGRPGHNLWDRCMHHFGIEYGYSLPIARRFNIDFTLGVGYMGGKYVEYTPKDKCYVWEATKYRHWVGPTKLEVSLVWLLGHGNYNKKKGGER